jgi:hypothetical protein
MKTIFILLFVIFLQNQLLSQNLSWSQVNADLGKSITDILQVNQNKLIIKSEKGVFIFSNLSEISRIDNLLPVKVKISCLALDTNKRLFAGTLNNGVFYFDESLNKWINISSKLENQNIFYIAISNRNDIAVWACCYKIYFYNSNDSSWNRKIKFQSPGNYSSFIRFSDKCDLYGCYNGTFSKLSKDYSGEVMKTITDVGRNDVNNMRTYNHINYVSTDKCGIFVSSDLDSNWKGLFEGLEDVNNIIDVLATKNEEILALSQSSGVYYSNNHGTAFEENNSGLPSRYVLTGIVLPDDKILISLYNYGLYISDPPKNLKINQVGWSNQTNYLQRRAAINGIDFIKFSNDGKKIFTISGSELKIWETETGYLLKKHLYPSPGLINASISNDDSTIVLTYRFGIYYISTDIYNINNDSLIYNYYTHIAKMLVCSTPYQFSIIDSKSDYISKNKILYTSFSYWTSCDGSAVISKNFGRMFKVDFNFDSLKSQELSVQPVINHLITSDNKLIILTEDSDGMYYSGNTTYNVNYILSIGDSNFKNTKTLETGSCNEKNHDKYDPIKAMNYLEKSNILIVLHRMNKFNLWNLNTSSIIGTCQLPQKAADYVFSKNNKYIIVGYSDGIYTLSFPEMNILDIIPFKYESGYNWKIAVSPDSSSYAFGSYDGIIRLVKSKIISDVNENNNPISHNSEINKMIIYPNPGTDFINIKGISIGIIEIFSVEGVKVKELTTESKSNLQIDISDLTSGFYYIKIDNKYYKFIKL